MRWSGNFYANLQIRDLGKGADFHSPRGIWRDSEAQIEFGRRVSCQRFRRFDWAERFGFRYNLKTYAPVAQLDRVLGYEPRGWEFDSLRAHQLSKTCSRVRYHSAQTLSLMPFISTGSNSSAHVEALIEQLHGLSARTLVRPFFLHFTHKHLNLFGNESTDRYSAVIGEDL